MLTIGTYNFNSVQRKLKLNNLNNASSINKITIAVAIA